MNKLDSKTVEALQAIGFNRDQLKILNYIINHDYYPLRIFVMLQYISTNTINGQQKWPANKQENNEVPKKLNTKCPHCKKKSNLDFKPTVQDRPIKMVSGFLYCHVCEKQSKLICLEGELEKRTIKNFKELWISPPVEEEVPEEVNDEDIRRDYKEAILCLDISPRASAMMSRYCLQKILRRKGGIQKSSLKKELQDAIQEDSKLFKIKEQLKAVKDVGNYANHDSNDIETGELIDVTYEEADYLIEIIKILLDIYYVQSSRHNKQLENIEKKRQKMWGKDYKEKQTN